MKLRWVKLGTVPTPIQLRRAYKLRPGLRIEYRQLLLSSRGVWEPAEGWAIGLVDRVNNGTVFVSKQ